MRPAILNPLFTPVTDLPGIGPKSAKLIERVAGTHVWDLMRAQPSRMQQRTKIKEPTALYEDQLVTLPLFVLQHFVPRSPKAPYRVNCMAGETPVSLVFFNAKGSWLQGQLPVREERVVSGKLARFNNNWQITHPDYMVPVEEADSIPAVEPIYPLTQGLTTRVWNKALDAALERLPLMADLSADHRKTIAAACERCAFDLGDVIFEEGDAGDERRRGELAGEDGAEDGEVGTEAKAETGAEAKAGAGAAGAPVTHAHADAQENADADADADADVPADRHTEPSADAESDVRVRASLSCCRWARDALAEHRRHHSQAAAGARSRSEERVACSRTTAVVAP